MEGKRISAALFSNLLRTTLHFLTRESSSAASVVGEISSSMRCFDAEGKVLTYTDRDMFGRSCFVPDGAVERLPSKGLPVGIESCQHLSEISIQLFPVDVVYFTDGVVEMVNGEGSPFGDERLVEIARTHRAEPAERIQEGILNALGEFSHAPLRDDLTIIVTKVLDQ